MRLFGSLVILVAWGAVVLTGPAQAENVVVGSVATAVAAPIRLTPAEAERLIELTADYAAAAQATPADAALAGEVARVRAKLDAHVSEFVEGFPWLPFHHTHGISGYEAYFAHPDQMYYALSLTWPALSAPTQAKVKAFLAEQLAKTPPYAQAGFPDAEGKAREAYDVPANLRLRGRNQATNALGVYAFWAYCRFVAGPEASKPHYAAVKERLAGLLARDYSFDVAGKSYKNDEAQKLTGDLAGLIGLYRLAAWNDDPTTRQAALQRLTQLLELRINLDRVNPSISEVTRSASKQLHVYKLARYCDLTPEVGRALAVKTDGLAAARLRAYREVRNGWYMAFGDRYIGGENYTSPPHFVRALFAGYAFIEAEPAASRAATAPAADPATALGFVDVPWCKGDLYFIETTASALWCAHGRPWVKAP